MKRIGIFILGIWFMIPPAVWGMDIRIAGGFGNLAFDSKRTLPLGSETFESVNYPYGLIRLEGDPSDIVSFDAGFERDPLLRNRITANVSFNTDYLRFDIGPFMGILNTKDKIINPGIGSTLTLEIPGIVFGSVTAASTLGAAMNARGDYLQESGEIALGFWIPYVICTLSVQTKAFTEQVDTDLAIKDELLRYQFRADIFTKNVPYTIYIDMGYQSLKRSYTTGITGVTNTDEFKSIYTGFEATLRVHSLLKLILGAEVPVYSWAEKPLKKSGNGLFFRAHAGLIITIPE
jgi:hypothetical protein